MAYVSSNAIAGRGTLLQYQQGSASPAVWVTINEMKKMSISGAKFDLADVTNTQSGAFREWLPTLLDSGVLSFEGNYLPGDATQDVLNTLFVNAILTQFRILFAGTLGNITFNAFVTSIDRTIEVDKSVVISVTLKITGQITLSN